MNDGSPDEFSPDASEGLAASLELSAPGERPSDTATWRLVAYSKHILRDWERLCRDTPADAERCYEWLSQQPMVAKKRCFALKGKTYAGCWEYEVGTGNRLYYKPDLQGKKVVVFYAGPHPKARIPLPPKGL